MGGEVVPPPPEPGSRTQRPCLELSYPRLGVSSLPKFALMSALGPFNTFFVFIPPTGFFFLLSLSVFFFFLPFLLRAARKEPHAKIAIISGESGYHANTAFVAHPNLLS